MARENFTDELLRASVAYVKGVGPSRAEVLAKLGLRRAIDLLFYFPRDYVEIRVKRDLDQLDDASVQSVIGVIHDFRSVGTRRGVLVKAFLNVRGKLATLLWFNAPYVMNSFRVGRPLMVTGKPKFEKTKWQFSHPTLTFLDTDLSVPFKLDQEEGEVSDYAEPDQQDAQEELYVLPIYHLTEGINQAQMQRITKNAIQKLPDVLPEALPQSLLDARALPSIADAVRKIHWPHVVAEASVARKRFAYQELLILQLALALCKARRLVNMRAPALVNSAKIDARIRRLFPFDLTPAQNSAIKEIVDDMARPSPMNRLLQGDVGSGKTAVAIYAALLAVANGAQAVLMAPTETLARQHLQSLEERLRGSATRIAPILGGQKPSERARILASIESGESQIIVGTQALVCNEIKFKRLGLVIIDEQHKFGVKQRAALKSSLDPNLEPHYLVMTATPIPRSVAMTLFGDLDVSVMKGLPPGRSVTKTALLTERTRASWWNFVRQRLNEGRQAYVIVARLDGGVEQTEELNLWDEPAEPSDEKELALNSLNEEREEQQTGARLKTVWSVYKELSEGELKGYRLGILHGRMSSQEKESVMREFRAGEIQVLVATVVVEVGVDVPNATVMTIEDADRFGLASLHQLRGRVGRGEYPGYCAVAPTEYKDAQVKADLKPTKSKSAKTKDRETSTVTKREEALERLTFFTTTTDGFELAEHDFQSRGAGQLFGAKQHGSTAMRIANIARDREILEEATRDARSIIAADPGLTAPELALLRRQVLARYGNELDLGDVG